MYCKNFEELDKNELYAIAKLRQEVFVVEQNSVYLDLDDLDQSAIHYLDYCQTDNLKIYARYRKNTDFGGAAASVTPKKQQRIIKAALSYQQRHAPQSSMRFDVVAIEGDNSGHRIKNTTENDTEIDWIKSAFDGF